MADDPSPSSPTVQRPKPNRTATTGTVRARASPPPGHSADQPNDGRPPTKRARKAINCEPCRNSKLKCDRNRPCSSCVLRGTSAMCYQDGRGPESSSDPLARGDDTNFTRIDPAQEIARLRHSISLLEAYVFPAHRNHAQSHRRPSDASAFLGPKKEVSEDGSEKPNAAPGVLGQHVQGGLYAGPTSAATHLIINDNSDDSDSRQPSQDRASDDFPGTVEYDRDLLAMLPTLEVIDGLIKHYFEYCNWIYRHINQPWFTSQWERFKNGASSDRVVLATACVMMAIAVHYLPQNHQLLDGFDHESHEEVGTKFYEVSSTALQRRLSETRAYSLELVELLLCRCHFLTLSKTDSEEIWHVRGELVTIGMAMGLHRDPGKWRMPRDVAERRRWAWWHIILLERWQAFMFGRPLAVASHHFDTQLPSYCDPALDKTSRLYLPNIALFKLAFILGDIMDDAVSVRPVPYESVQANDRALTQWAENLPPELDLDEYRVARSLASPHLATRRQGVQSVIIRTSYYHIRFTLHRPYASANLNSNPANNKPAVSPEKQAQSLEIAVSAADKLITMVGQSRPDFLANSSLAVPGHMNWGPFHCFSAAMFFSFQLIANPDQPGAGLFRQSIQKAVSTLEQCRGTGVADKGYNILHALSPLYSPELLQSSPEEREKQRSQVLGVVKKLAFPYHDSHDPRRYGDSPSGRGTVGSPANSSSVSPPMQMMQSLPQHYESLQSHAMTSMRTPTNMYSQPPVSQGHMQALSQSPQSQPQIVHHPQSLAGVSTSYQQPYSANAIPQGQQQVYSDHNRYGVPYVHAVEDSAIWGAAVGFGQGEWSQFLDGFKQEPSVVSNRHIHNT
ncbi:hypothetical protein FA15DRAFT_582359 [Coprinopsis marcescibilis]|uniref:Zn(2)-C6 fungal-type domain-containing protein n=1 Tax=Coprinopsis marcescibilis TaxID=230819 RepID=A0A5C3L9A6_COPMA|nr:hypothetical protein FA15DRAFT_582359 [Coprinopsis marcescibilis]